MDWLVNPLVSDDDPFTLSCKWILVCGYKCGGGGRCIMNCNEVDWIIDLIERS
jgi:hypothetical protein